MAKNQRIFPPALKFIGKVVDQCSKEILKYTPQLYTKKPNETEPIKPDPDSSGVLLRVKGQHFLITAGHIFLENNAEDIGIMIGNTFNILKGDVKYVNPSQSEQADKIDIAVWKLEDDVVKSLELGYSFLPFEKIDFEHNIETEPKYLVVGFPWRGTTEDKANKKLKSSPLIFLTKKSESPFYKRLKFEEHSNLLIDYRQKKVKNFDTGQVQQNKSPEGVSGCGVWHIPKFYIPDGGVPDFKLVSQVIEQNKEKTILITTRIHLVTEVLRRDFGIDIPESTITKID
ncbi:MAG: hypothetical protein IH948_01580 [Bacteroidetes bacterium]|nr:hypothetical protein [Bacteroidota bacterium]